MKIDLVPGTIEPRRAVELAALAEEVGFDGLWAAETDHDPFIALGLAAAATRYLELGTAVAIAFARSPTVIAQTAFDLAALSHGRFQLGLGTQVRGHVERRFGMAWSEPAPRLAEWVGAIRAAWDTWQDGRPFRFSSAHLDLSLMTPFFSP
ncbi:MAG TPA: LLM class flavin-dependent oxidoreductase, partial [Candidatus Limnocylindrales bacterium]|nr:LLM class flavin-dependent oxidoreductase [Candidatus Limnocylindrales bacterium]